MARISVFICGNAIHVCFCHWPTFPQSFTLGLFIFSSPFLGVILHGLGFIQVLRVGFIQAFCEPHPGVTIRFLGLWEDRTDLWMASAHSSEFTVQGLSWLVSRQLGRAIERGSHISGLCQIPPQTRFIFTKTRFSCTKTRSTSKLRLRPGLGGEVRERPLRSLKGGLEATLGINGGGTFGINQQAWLSTGFTMRSSDLFFEYHRSYHNLSLRQTCTWLWVSVLQPCLESITVAPIFCFFLSSHEICKRLANHPLGKPGHAVLIRIWSTGNNNLCTFEMSQWPESTKNFARNNWYNSETGIGGVKRYRTLKGGGGELALKVAPRKLGLLTPKLRIFSRISVETY